MKPKITDALFETADVDFALPPVENFRGVAGLADYAAKNPNVSKETLETIQQHITNTHWLSSASKVYHTSPDASDYFTVPTIIMPTDLPNRNMTAFPREELARFDPEIGDLVYRGWIGKPVYVEHKNLDYTKAIGAVVDVSMRKIENSEGDIWKVIALMAIDRTKNRAIAEDILAGRRKTYSMGALVKAYQCSFCGAVGEIRPGMKDKYEALPCGKQHAYVDRLGGFREFATKNGGRTIGFTNALRVKPFEISSVGYPAFASAYTSEMEIKGL